MSDADKGTRRWRLRGYGKPEPGEKNPKPRHDSICRGDQALDDALARLERDPLIIRTTAERV